MVTTAAAVVSEATICTHMQTCKSAMLARSGRRGGGLFDRTISETSRKTAMVKRAAHQPHTGAFGPSLHASRVHEREHDLHALVGTRSRSWA